jgi:hypothetical protein
MRGDLTIRTTVTASGATAVQVVRNKGKRRIIVKHIGSAHDTTECEALLEPSRHDVERHCSQPSLLSPVPGATQTLHLAQIKLIGVTHRFARQALLACAARLSHSNPMTCNVLGSLKTTNHNSHKLRPLHNIASTRQTRKKPLRDRNVQAST